MAETANNAEQEEVPRRAVNLNGKYQFKVDGKGRVSLPSKFRKVLSKDLVVTVDTDGECLYVFESADFNAWVEQLLAENFGGRSISSRQYEATLIALKSRARDVEVDATGRIMLAADLRETVGIDKEVSVVGSIGRFEIWDAKRFDEFAGSIDLSLLKH